MRHAPELLPGFQQYQIEFAAHIRNPKQHKRPKGVIAGRMAVYNELLYNNIEGFLLACFPVMRKMLGKRRWSRLVRGFFSEHRCHTPYFRQIPDEFLQYLQHEWQPGPGYPEYLIELAHYEWIELVLSISNLDDQMPEIDPAGDLMDGIPALNPVMANLAYQWPVHRIRPRAKVEPSPACLLVYRNPGMHIRFLEQSQTSARLVALLEPGTVTGSEAVKLLAGEMGYANVEQLMAFAQGFLHDLKQAGVIFGTLSQ